MIYLDDFKYALRLLAKRPGFTLLTTLVMATGIGLSLFLFSFFYTTGYKPLPFKDSKSLVVINAYQQGVQDYGDPLNLHDYDEIRTTIKGLKEFSAYKHVGVNLSGRDSVRRYQGIAAEPNFFRLTRTSPILGRDFTADDNQISAQPVVVIGYDMWQNQFGGDKRILDETVRINGVSSRIVGVMPEEYYFPDSAEVWMPMRENAKQLLRGTTRNYYGLAHLQDGFTMENIDQQLMVIMKRLEDRFPKTNTGARAYVDTVQNSQGTRGSNVFIYAMYLIAIFILILASINVGNLLLSRAIERGKETAIRVALGAPRSRLISQMLWESIIICTLGGVIGLLMVAWGLEILESVVKGFWFGRPVFWWKFGLDAFTIKMFFCFVITAILLTGLLPAWRNSGSDFNAVLRDGTRGATGKKAGRLNRVLVISEIFLSMTIMIAASVVGAVTFANTGVDYGAETDNILIARVLMTESDYSEKGKRIKFVQSIESQLKNTTGIGDVMIMSALPGENSIQPRIAVDGQEYMDDKGYPRVNYIVTLPGSLAKLGVELVAGRYLDNSDKVKGASSIVVSESFVDKHYPRDSAIGKRIRLAVETKDNRLDWMTIVGVVENTIQGDPNARHRVDTPTIFRPYTQDPRMQISIAMKMKADKQVVVKSLRDTLGRISPELPAYRIETYVDKLERNIASMKFISTLLMLFGLAAVVLASSGIYGVMSNSIYQKIQEIGVKRALGASDKRVTQEFLFKGFYQFLWGGIPGLLCGSGLGYGMAQIFGIEGFSVLFLISAMVTLLIGLVVLLATFVPTKYALTLEPAEALRYE